MLIATVVALAALQAPAGQVALHPSEPVLYAECPDVARLLDAYGEAPLAQMLRDEPVRAAWRKLEGALGFQLGALVDDGIAGLGVPEDGDLRGLDALLAQARKVRSASYSLYIEGDPRALASATQRRAETYVELAAIEDALDAYAQAHEGRSPPTLADLRLAAELMSDAWERPYEYARAADELSYTLSSLGADGVAGGEGEGADVAPDTTLEAWMAAEMPRHVAGLLALDFVSPQDAERAVEAVRRASPGGADVAPSETPFRGATARVAAYATFGGLDVPGWTLQSGALVVFGLGAADRSALLARANAATSSSSIPAKLAELDALAGPASGVTVLRLVNQGAQLAELAAGRDLGPLTPLVKLLGASAPDARRVARMQLVGSRFVTDWMSVGGGADSWTSAIGAAPVTKEVLAFVPDDAAGVLVTQVDGRKLMQQMLSLAGSASNGGDARAMLAEIEQKHGFSLEQDLFANLAGPAAVYVLPITAIGLPNVTLVLELRDAEAFAKGVRGLVALLVEEGQKVKETKYRDAPMWTLSLGEEAAAIPFLSASPTVAIIGKRALVTLTSLRAKKEVKRALGEEQGKPHPIAALATPAEATVVGCMDWAGMFDSVYLAGKGALTAFGGMAGDSAPFDLNALSAALPESSATFTHFFEPTTIWSKPVPGGSFGRYEASFGPETWGSIVIGATVALPTLTRQRDAARTQRDASAGEQADGAPQDPAAQATQVLLLLISTRIAVFQLDQGKLPGSLTELCKPTPNYPRGFLDSETPPNDGWSRAFRYELGADGTYRLWSTGADGVDGNGTGDDVVAP